MKLKKGGENYVSIFIICDLHQLNLLLQKCEMGETCSMHDGDKHMT
jgi:hypothetical protein